MKLFHQIFHSALPIVLILLIVIFWSSCIPQKNLRYVQNKGKNDTITSFLLKHHPKNTIQPFDNLYIKVISPDVNTTNMFNSETQNVQNVNYNMISYSVNDSGYIEFPFVGKINVKDLTIIEAKDTIKAALSKYISNTSVIVKFVGKSITILGEVVRQGEFVIYSDDISIFKALAMAGGLTDYGNREKVTIIREENNKSNFYNIDLTNKKITASELYYLKPGDVVIIDPLKQKSYGFSTFPYSLFLSAVTTIVVLLTFLRTQ